MSLLNDALRKKNSEDQKKDNPQRVPPPLPARAAKRLRISRIVGLLLIGGIFVIGVWYVWGSLYPQEKSALTAARVPQNIEIDTSNPIAKNSAYYPKEPEYKTKAPEPIREITPLPDPAASKPVQKVKQTAKKNPVPKIVLPPSALKAEKKPPKVPKKSIKKSAKSKIKSQPSNQVDLFLHKALGYHRQGQISQAIQMYQQVLMVDPNQQKAAFNLASAYIQLEAYSEAYTLLKKLKVRDPLNPDVLLNLAIVEIGLGKPAEALILLERASQHIEEPQFGIYFHRAAALSRLGRLEEARSFYKKSEKLNPRHLTLIFNLAVLCDKLRKYDEAVDYYQTFLQSQEKLSDPEKKNIEARVRSLNAFLAAKQS
ncbi:MAG: tetratricopeptide repeat protein [Deltaproteobacteria bacterium]|nr:tetratricopeptide repeat protein [Deltaproteobacteria bacterium]